MRLSGLGVSPGIGIGKALVLKRGAHDLRFRIPAARVGRELERLDEARSARASSSKQIKERIATSAGAEHAYLFDAQLLMLDDAMLIDARRTIIRTEQLNAASALERALDEISALFDQRRGSLPARAQGRRRRRRRPPVHEPARPAATRRISFTDLEGPLVLVADELTPSVIAQLDWQRLAAFVTDAGSWTYHTAILARSIHIPAVAGLHNASTLIAPGALLAVDGATGEVLVDPDAATLQQFEPGSSGARVRTVAGRIPRAAAGHRRRRRTSASTRTSSRPTTR